MYRRPVLLLVASIVFSAAISIVLWTSSNALPTHKGPKLLMERDTFDLGVVDEGIEVRHRFKLQNVGSTPLKLLSAETSCGCTTARFEKSILAPGEVGGLDVVMDTSMKQGHVKKEIVVTTNEPVPHWRVYLIATVKDPHEGMAGGAAKIFSGRCAACHVQQGIGKDGIELFMADCAMCHGFRGEGGGVATALVPRPYDVPAYREYARQVISHGSKTHRSMPGFLKESGGPLSKEQIESLIDYLRYESGTRSKQ